MSVILVKEEPISCLELIEVLVIADFDGQFTVNLPDSQQLKSDQDQTIIVKAIQVTTPEVLTNGVVSGLVTSPITEMQKISLVLYSMGWERIHYLPLLRMNDVSTPGGAAPHRYVGTRFNDIQKVDWPKSFFKYSGGTGGVVSAETPYCIMLTVEYVKLIKVNNQLVELTGPNA